jgi:hypothetical protein
MKKLKLFTYIVVFLIILISGAVDRVEAKTVSYSKTMSGVNLYYCWNRAGTAAPAGYIQDPNCVTTVDASSNTLNWSTGLQNPNITVTYGATITNLDTGQLVNDGDTLPTGSHLRLTSTPHVSNDAYWFGTGAGLDSPYGDWVANAPAPAFINNTYITPTLDPRVSSSFNAMGPNCDAKDHIAYTVLSPRTLDIQIPFEVSPPTGKTITSSNLSCAAPTTSSDGLSTISEDCTVTAAGPIATTFIFPSTNGKFFYHYFDSGGTSITGVPPTILVQYFTIGCYGNKNALRTASATALDGFGNTQVKNGFLSASDYVVSIPQQTIGFNLTGAAPAGPSAPILACPATAQNINTDITIGLTSTSPSGKQVQYAVDWLNSGTQNSGWSALVSSGVQGQIIKTGGYAVAGTYTVNGWARDSSGTMSSPSSCTVTILPPPPTNLTATCNAAGDHVNLSWATAPGATSYYPRMFSDPAYSTAAMCASVSWQLYGADPRICYPNPDIGQPGTSIASFPITPGQTYSWWVHSANASGVNWASQSPTSTFTCPAPPPPDLTPTGLTPSGTVAGQNTPFTGTVLNNGGSATPQFESSMYICPQGDSACKATGITMNIWQRIFAFFVNVAHAATQVKVVFSRMTLAAGASGNQTATYNFPTPGSYEIRYCVDLPKNEVTELDENNNCQNWTAFTVCPTGQLWNGTSCVLPTLSCSPSPSSVNPTNNVTWTANPQGYTPTTYVWTTPPGGAASTFTNSYNVSGAHYATVRAYNGTTDLTADCSPVTVNGSCGVTPNTSLTASPDLIGKGKTSTLTYSAGGFLPNTGTCTITGTDGSTWTTPTVDNLCTESGTHVTPPINARTVFTLHCTNGATDATATVNVSPSFTEF